MLFASIAIVIGMTLLVWSADKFVMGASGIAKNFQVPPIIIGLTIVSLCTSLPEMLVALLAALEGNNDLGIGNAIGSNIANIGLVLGITALIAPLAVQSKVFKRELPMLLFIMVLALVLMLDGDLSLVDGVVLLVGLILLVLWLLRLGLKERDAALEAEFEGVIPENTGMKASVLWFIIGLIVLLASSKLVVFGAVEVATLLGVSDLVIGLTIVAIGTSLPELVASIVSVLKNEAELAIGNVIGSNMFNILAVLAMPALFAPGSFDMQTLMRDIPIMFIFTAALFLVAYGFRGVGRITRLEGGVLLSGYIGYLYLLYLQA
ncbi:MAG TPA: calcium/sodium antiporter [Ghiorsea sp.]|nr:calcium/sodium antiporter [Ghiorsea sp.]HIP07481.1 calcium/sodium antiporter [Mariprofundaceae bacterium]